MVLTIIKADIRPTNKTNISERIGTERIFTSTYKTKSNNYLLNLFRNDNKPNITIPVQNIINKADIIQGISK